MSDLGPGVYPDMSMDDYLALPYVGSSDLRGCEQYCPRWARWRHDHPHKSTPTQIRGSLFALFVEDEDAYETAVAVVAPNPDNPESNRWVKAGTAAKVKALAAGYTVLRPDQDAEIRAMAVAAMACPDIAVAARSATHREPTLIWDDDDTGLRCKARPDVVSTAGLYDWKTCADASEWSHVIRSLLLHVQAQFHTRGAVACGLMPDEYVYAWLVVENTPPYCTAGVQLLGPEYRDIAESIVVERMAEWLACTEAGVWPAYRSDSPTPPEWYFKQFIPT